MYIILKYIEKYRGDKLHSYKSFERQIGSTCLKTYKYKYIIIIFDNPTYDSSKFNNLNSLKRYFNLIYET